MVEVLKLSIGDRAGPAEIMILLYRMNENSPEKGGLGACVENVRCAHI